MRLITTLLLAATVLPVLPAQLTVVTPPGYDLLEGNSNNAFPWNRGTASMRYQQLYDSTSFPAITGPVLITGMRFRANGTTATWTGGSWPNVQIDLSTATVDHAAFSLTFDSNHGPDRTTVHNGSVTVQPGTGNGTTVPGPWHIAITFGVPFLYDPSSGNDLCMDVMLDGAGWSGGSTQADAHSGTAPPALCSRLWFAGNHQSPTAGGSAANYGIITEFTYVPPQGYARASTYGQGCYFDAISWYESFPVGTFDLGSATSTNSIMVIPTGTGWFVAPVGSPWVPPVSANLGLADDSVTPPISLPFTFPYPGGSTTAIQIESNGNVWLQAPTHASFICNTSPGALLSRGPVISAFYDDLDPSATGGGSVHYDVDPSGQIVYITWVGVPIWLASPPPSRPTNTFQVALYSSGQVELRYQGMDSTGSWTSTLTGMSPGMANLNPGNRDISAAMPFLTRPDSLPLAMAPVGRPVVGSTTFGLRIGNIQPQSLLGALVLSLGQFNPGLSLQGLGMPDCYQYVGSDAVIIVPFAGSSATVPMNVPNNPVLAGLRLYGQAVSFLPGINPLGMVSSNGVAMQVDLL